MWRISPNHNLQDGAIARPALPQVFREIEGLRKAAGARRAHVFHGRDAKQHPLGLVGRRIPGETGAGGLLSNRILELCIGAGGLITGEDGVGEDKKKIMSKMFSEPDLDTMQRVRCAFDPLQLSNPTKIFPRPRLCGEKPGEYVAHPLETAGVAERY